MITPDDHFPSGADSLDLTRLHQLLTEMPKETGTGAKDPWLRVSNQGTRCNYYVWYYIFHILTYYIYIWIYTNMCTYYVYTITCQSSWWCMFTEDYLLTNNKGWTAHVPLAFSCSRFLLYRKMSYIPTTFTKTIRLLQMRIIFQKTGPLDG